MEDVARVVLAIEQHDVAEEVLHFLDRSGRTRVVATAADDRQLLEAVRQLEPDAVIGQPSLVGDNLGQSRAFLAVDTRESVASLRAAIRAGADGFFVWPTDREALSTAAAATMARPAALDRRAIVIAVHASSGGAGLTFVATHLARAFARRGKACIVIEGDPLVGEVSAALGAPADDTHTMGDLLPLAAELTPANLEATLWTHPTGFRALLAPPAEEASGVEASHVRRFVDIAASVSDVVVVHLPRSVDAIAQAMLDTSDRVVEVLSLDVLSFRAAKRTLESMRPLDLEGRVGFVVNRAGRAEITPRDVVRVFGCEPLAVVPNDRRVTQAQDHGRLISTRGRAGRAFDRLAARLEKEASRVSPMPAPNHPQDD